MKLHYIFCILLSTSVVLAEDSTQEIKSHNDSARALVKQGNYPEAENEFRAALAIREKTLGAENQETLMNCFELAGLLAKEKKYPEALEFAKRAESGFAKLGGPDQPFGKIAATLRQNIETEMKGSQ